MSIAAEALIQVALMVLTGYLIRQYMNLSQGFWRDLSRLTYFLFTPALLISSLSNKPLQGIPWLSMATVLVGVLLMVSLALVLWQLYVRPVDWPSFTSIFQGGVRFNSFVVLAIVYHMYGDAGFVIAAVATAITIITVNILCLLIFAVSNGDLGNWRNIILQLLGNPLILGCILGLAINLGPVKLPGFIDGSMAMLGQCALPMALLSIGAGLTIKQEKKSIEMVATATLIQLFAKPVLTILLAHLLGIQGITLVIIVILMAVPTAPSSYVLALQLGGNSNVMASIITSQTLLALITLPVTLYCVIANGH